jgi:hypothetical protein
MLEYPEYRLAVRLQNGLIKPDGDDINDGNSEATAYATLQKAIDESESGTETTVRSYLSRMELTVSTGQTSPSVKDGFPTAIVIKI